MSLAGIELLDCQGSVTHRLRLEYNGSVSIAFTAGPTARVDPRTRTNLTPHIAVTPSLMDAAVGLQPW